MNPLAYLGRWARARRRRAYYGVDRSAMNDIEQARMWRNARESGARIILDLVQR